MTTTTWGLAQFTVTLPWAASVGSAQESWTPAQEEVLAAIRRLSASTAALAEVWVREDGDWRLLRVDVHSQDSP